jgi:flagellin-like protein
LRFKKRRAVSPVIAELLLIVITVAIGTLVYSFASTAFGGFGAGFSNLVQNAGSQLTENVVVDQVAFLHNDSGIANGCGAPLECAGDIFVGNAGSNTATINEIYATNVTSGTPLGSSDIQFSVYCPGHKYVSPCPSAPGPISIAPGQTIMVRFETTTPVASGSTYAFTLITARGNQIVAYEKA